MEKCCRYALIYIKQVQKKHNYFLATYYSVNFFAEWRLIKITAGTVSNLVVNKVHFLEEYCLEKTVLVNVLR